MDSSEKSVSTDDSIGSAIGDVFHSAAYSAVEGPINALGKLTKEVTGTRLLPELNIFGAPEQVEFGTKRWHAQQVGFGVGMIVPFLATKGAMKSAGLLRTAEPALGLAGSLSVGQKALLVGENVAAGVGYSALFQNAEGTGMDYWQNKGKNAAVTGVAFGTFTGLNFLGKESLLKTGLAGAGAGSVAADTHSLLEGRGLASMQQRAESAYSFAFTGLALKGAENTMAKARSQSVQDAIGKIKNPELKELHDLNAYSKAFEGFNGRVKKSLGGGADSVVFEMMDGNILKLTTKSLPKDAGSRGFDQPIIETGSRTADGVTVNYFVQPKATPARPGDLDAVNRVVKENGYLFRDPAPEQIGRVGEKPYLLDPFAVVKNSHD